MLRMYGHTPRSNNNDIETRSIFARFLKNFFVYRVLFDNTTINGPATNKMLTHRVRRASPKVTPNKIVGFFNEKDFVFNKKYIAAVVKNVVVVSE